MTRNLRIQKRLPAALFSLALAGSAGLGYGQGAQDFIVSQFDDGGTTQGWAGNYGNAPYTIEYDANENRGPGAIPGALKVTINFNPCNPNPTPPPDFTPQIQRDWEKSMGQALDLTKYTKLHFSVKVDPSSSHLSDWGAGALGNLRPHIRKSDWSGDSNLGSAGGGAQWVGADAYGAWKDYSYPIDQTLNNLAVRQAMGVWGFDMWSGWGSCAAPIGHTNTVIFWIDNIWFEADTNTAAPPIPSVALSKPGAQGVQITVDDNASQWQRDAIATPSGVGNLFWGGSGNTPVTYSFTIAEFPDPVVHEGFEAHLFLVNRDTSTAGDETYGGCDWNAPDIAIVSIWSVTNNGGTYTAQFQFKTNRANNNPLDDAVHRPATLTNLTAVLGTWTLSFVNDTNGTLSGPGGVSTNFTIPIEAVQNNFSPANAYAQFGFHKNDGENDGHNNQQRGTFSRIKSTGGSFPFDDAFDGPTYTSQYAWRKTSASAVQHVPPGTAWHVSWPVPADGFNLESAAALTGPWDYAKPSNLYQSGGRIHAVIPAVSLPPGNSTYFRAIKRPFIKLQVLMPGETNAPYTATGKIGTPDPQTAGVPFNVIVNAVDEKWNRVTSDLYNKIPSTDTIHITSSDGGATLPADAAMGLGSATFSVTLTAGTWTVTGTDVTNGARTPNTSSPTLVQ